MNVPESTKKIYFVKSKNKEEIKNQKIKYCKEYNNNTLIDWNDNYNAILYHIQKDYIIIDIDSKEGFNFVNNILTKYQICNKNITKSISNYKHNNYFKYHIYFKNNLHIEKDYLLNGLDILTNRLIFEDSKRFNKNIDLLNLPDIPESFFNDLLQFGKKNIDVINNVKNIDKVPNGPICDFIQKDIKPKNKKKNIEFKDDNNFDIKFNEDNLTELLLILSDSRVENYGDWFNIGQIIYNINNNYLHIFKNFSMRCMAKYNENELSLKWNEYSKMENNHNINKLTIATLFYMAKNDNEEEYKKWYTKYCKKIKFNDYYYNILNYEDVNINNIIFDYIIFDLKGIICDHDYARIFKLLYKNFIYSNENLYFYNNVIWKKQSKIESDLIQYVSVKFFEYLNTLFNLHIAKIKKINDINCDDNINFISKIKVSITKLKSNSERKNIIHSIKSEIENNNIIFDSYFPNLIAFNNAIFDLENKKFIQSKPEYYMSMSCGYDYIFYKTDEDKNKHEIRKNEILNLLNSIFPLLDIRNYYLKQLAMGMGGNLIEKFIICTGSGGNGKSLLHEFFKCMLGEYSYSLPVHILTHDLNNTGGPNPVLANLHLKRFVLTSEPESCKRLKCSTIKEITGNTNYNARTCHETKTDKILAMSLFLECNNKPLVDEVDEGLGRRLRVINFDSKFINKEDYKHIINDIDKSDDLSIEEKNNIKKKYGIVNVEYKTNKFKIEYRQALFDILNGYYEIYNKNNFEIIPEEIKNNTKCYLELSGDIIPFIQEYYYKPDDYNDKKNENDKYKISLIELYSKFIDNPLYINMTKEAKRSFNKSKFSDLLQKFFPIDFRKDKYKTYVLFNYKSKIIENININNDFLDE